MSVYTSKKLSRAKAREIVCLAMENDGDLKDMVSLILEKYTFRNCYRLVEPGEPNDDDDSGVAGWIRREPM